MRLRWTIAILAVAAAAADDDSCGDALARRC